MKTNPLPGVLALWLAAASGVLAAVRYVDINNPTPSPPYDTWATAATNIQEAADAALGGDQILVTNGVYQTGGVTAGLGGARVVVDKPLRIQSVNGPPFTAIEGGPGMRCVLLANGSFLAGFTLTNGSVIFGGLGGGVAFRNLPSDAVVSNCVIVGCAAGWGGGAASSVASGGPPGLNGGTLLNCTLRGNSANGAPPGFGLPPASGGGADGCKLINCTLSGNTVAGAQSAQGAGASSCALQNCLLTGNSVASGPGGGAAYSDLIHCTVVSNTASSIGGAYACSLRNSIVYYNSDPDHAADNDVRYSCTTPLADGLGNVADAPLFVSPAAGNYRLRAGSPCINAGNNDYVTGSVDVEGKERVVDGTVDMGAYEWIDRPTHYVSLSSPNPVPPYLSWSTAATNIQDAIDASWSGFPRRVLVTNGIYQTGGRAVGSYGWRNRVVVPGGIWVESVNGPQVTVIQGSSPASGLMRCVYMIGSSRLSGFTLTNGSSEKTIYIFTGDSSANYGGGVYCSSFFSSIAVLSNCVLTGNSAIAGGGASGATLVRCTLIGNSALDNGGGAQGSKLYDCTLATNSVDRNGYGGGGAYSCTLSNCALIGNSAPLGGGTRGGYLINSRMTGNVATDSFGYGGGAFQAYLVNCILTGNVADYGGGARDSTLINCSVFQNGYQNRSFGGGVYGGTQKNCSIWLNFGLYANYYQGSFEYCCTWPLPSGLGNTSDSSACLDAGNNDLVTFATDVNGRPRIVNGRVDIGAAEFQGPFDEYLQKYGLPTDGSVDFIDLDGDGLNNWLESLAGTVPTNAASLVRLVSVSPGAAGVTVSWQSVSNRIYFLERSTNLAVVRPFSLVASEIPGEPDVTSFTDTNATGSGPYFYRVAVQAGQRPFAYATNDGAITITGYTGSGGAEALPGVIHGLPVTRIGDYAFYNKSSLSSLTIPEGVTNIGTAAFLNCYNLKEVTIPNTVTSIGNSAFAGTGLEAVILPHWITDIGEGTFSSCYSLTNITLPTGVTNIGASGFAYCVKLSKLAIPNGVTAVGDSAFANCSGLRSIALPDSVVTLGAAAFFSCTSLTNITLGNSVTSIPYQAFSNCLSLAGIVIPDSVMDVGDGAFGRCTNLASVSIGSRVERIGNSAFYWCSSLTDITIPDAVTTIGDWAFFVCENLSSVTIGNGVAAIGQHAFENCTRLTNAILGSSVASIGGNAFSGTSLGIIAVPGSVTNIGAGTFGGCYSLMAIMVEPSNLIYSSIGGVLFDRSGATLIQCPAGKTGAYVIPDGVADISPSSFWGGKLETVTIPNSVTNIGAWAFGVSWALTNITVGSGVTFIGDGAFYYCQNLIAARFLGNAPALGGPNVFISVLGFPLQVTVYYVPGATGWGPAYGGRPTATWTPPNP